jgi:hypothetical protein
MRLFTLFLALFVFSTASAQHLVSYELKASLSPAEIMQVLDNAPPTIENGVDVYKILYVMDDVFGNPDTASGALHVPWPAKDQPGHPLVCDMHGTTDRTWYPSDYLGTSGLYFAGNGFLAIEPDYLGLGNSRGFHPYVHADSEARSGVEMLRAAHQFFQQMGISPGEDLFISGYSQGGHSAMAMHRMIQEDLAGEFTVTASSPMSGPYSLSGIMFDRMLDDQDYLPGIAFMPYLVLSYRMVYQDLNVQLSDVFKSWFVNPIQQFYDGQITLSNMATALGTTLFLTTGKLNPRDMLQPDLLAQLQADPESHPLFAAIKDNDLLDWVPEAPMRLFHCEADEQVPYTNSLLAEEVFNANGAPEVIAQSKGATLDHGGCFGPANIATLEFFQSVLISSRRQVYADHDLMLFPNPSVDRLYLRSTIGNTPVEGLVMVYDQSGRILRQDQLREGGLSVQDLAPGLYFLRLVEQGAVLRFVKG